VSQGTTLPHHFSTNSVKVIAIVIIVPSVSTIRLFAMKIPAIMKVTEEDHHQT
jgi:hypothetical protein